MMTHILVSTLILAPFIGFLLNSVCSWNLKKASLIGCASCFLSFTMALTLFITQSGQPITVSFFPWLSWESLNVNFSFLLDSISLIMALVITGVGFLIHLFSVEYMNHDERPARYFSFLNLFLFNMLVLILADNLLLLFVGWEGVGLCSYLLIGFWYKDIQKAQAGMKAFIANRIGDAGFLIGMFLFFSLFESLNFSSIQQAGTIPSSLTLTATCLLLFVGATGKSAQFPLFVWLPSAMAGPTPVSALIHAATMVTAGIYLILRTLPLWLAADFALDVVAFIGVFTALIGAYQACREWDVKKILAYSTISQLGYMFLAIGVGAYASSLFHLVTHAFFKAGLFLAAGSLIHGLNGEQDIRKMGNLRKKMPYTFWSFLLGSLALMGLPPLSGFFSKDEILYNAFHNGYYIIWALALIGAGMTAFYTTKTLYYVFFKQTEVEHKAHEGGFFMKVPLVILSGLALFAGVLQWPHFLPAWIPYQWLGNYTSLILDKTGEHSTNLEMILAGSSVLFILIVLAFSIYILKINTKCLDLFKHVSLPWDLNHFYQQKLIQPTMQLSRILLKQVEIGFIQKTIDALSAFLIYLRKIVIRFQSGFVDSYLLFMSIGMIIFIFVILWR